MEHDRFAEAIRRNALSEGKMKIDYRSEQGWDAETDLREFYPKLQREILSLPGRLPYSAVDLISPLFSERDGSPGWGFSSLDALRLSSREKPGFLDLFDELGIDRLFSLCEKDPEARAFYVASYIDRKLGLTTFALTVGLQRRGPEVALRVDAVWKRKSRWKGECRIESGPMLASLGSDPL